MTTVWVVTSGQYSDYGIIAICSTKEKAERTKELTGADNDIFEMEVDEALNCVPVGFSGWSVDMNRHGEVRNIQKISVTTRDQLKAIPYGTRIKYPNNVENCYNFGVVAKDERGAVKVANEKRAEIISFNAWFEGHDAWQRWNEFLNKFPFLTNKTTKD